MDNTEKIFKQLIKSAPVPELNADFTSIVIEKSKLLKRAKADALKPLINPLVLWIGFILLVLIASTLNFGSKALNIEFPALLIEFDLIGKIKTISNNYLIMAYTLLILLWFVIDYKLADFRKSKFLKK